MILNEPYTKTIKIDASSVSQSDANRVDACGPRCSPTSTDEHSQNHSQFRSDNGDAARACMPIDDGGFTTAILGELGWEPPNQSRHGEEPVTVTNDGKKPHASDERVKVSPSSARL